MTVKKRLEVNMTCCHDLDRTCGRPHATSVQSNASGISQLDRYTLKEMKASERLDYLDNNQIVLLISSSLAQI